MFKFSRFDASRVVCIAAGATLVVGIGLLAGCPSHSTTKTPVSSPPVAQAAGFHGQVYGGRQPIQGATVVAYASGTSVGAVPTQLGTAVTSGPGGTFNIVFSPAPQSGQVIYAIAKGGIAVTGGQPNPAIRLLTIAGTEGSTLAPVAGTVNINELTTVASTAALKNYIHFVDCSTTAITGNTQTGTCLSVPGALGLRHMAATVNNLVNVETGLVSDFLATNSQTAGAALTTTRLKLNTLASVLAGCVNGAVPPPPSTAPAPACASLFVATGGHPGTLMAAWLVARMPAINAGGKALYTLLPTAPVYEPVLATAPATFSAGFWTVGGERYAFTANSGGNDVSALRLTRSGGKLTEVAGNACSGVTGVTNCFPAGSNPRSVTVDPSGRYLYVADRGTSQVSAYTIGMGGVLTPVPGSPFLTGLLPHSVAVDPTGRYLYTANFAFNGGSTVSAFTIGAGGVLTPVAGGPCTLIPSPNNCFAAGNNPASVTVDPSGRYVYVANLSGNDVSAYTIGAGGALAPVAGNPCGSPLGVTNCFAVGDSPVSVSADPTGRYLYTANRDSNNISAFTIGVGGVLTPVAGSLCSKGSQATNCFAAGSNPRSVTVDSSGHYLYTANYNGSDVSAFTIGVAGVLTPIAGSACSGVTGVTNCFATGAAPDSVTVDPTGRYLFTANQPENDVSVFTIEAGGALAPVAGSPCQFITNVVNCFAAGNLLYSVTVDPTGRYLYTANYNGNDVSAFRIGTGGVPTPVTGAVCSGVTGVANCFASGNRPESAAMDPMGRYVYVANRTGNDISAYTIGAGGDLTPVAGTACSGVSGATNCFTAGNEPESVAMDPMGRYVYVANRTGNDISAYTIGASGGLTPVVGSTCSGASGAANCFAAGAGPVSATVDPTGRYLYVGNEGGSDVSAYAIGAGGALTPLAGSVCSGVTGVTNCFAAGAAPASVTVDSMGRYLYIANYGSNNVSAFTIGAGGVLTPVAGIACSKANQATNCFAAGTDPASLTVGPMGRYLYVGNEGGSDISVYTIGAGGVLTPIVASLCSGVTGVANCFATGANPRLVTVDPTGRYLYTANAGGDDVSVYTIGAGGMLTPIAGSVCSGVTGVSNCFAVGDAPWSIVTGP